MIRFGGCWSLISGAIGVVETIWLIPPSAGIMLDDALQVVGIEVSQTSACFLPASICGEKPDRKHPMSGMIRGLQLPRGALREELAYFCDCVLDDRAPQVITGDEAMSAVEVALALVESAQSDKEIEIPARRA